MSKEEAKETLGPQVLKESFKKTESQVISWTQNLHMTEIYSVKLIHLCKTCYKLTQKAEIFNHQQSTHRSLFKTHRK